MKPLTAPELINVWERSLPQPLIDKSILLLRVASSKNDEDPLMLSVGQRNLKLLQLREWMFGSRLLNTAICTCCGQKVEWENNVNDLKQQDEEIKNSHQHYRFLKDEFSIIFRLPVNSDMLQLNAGNSVVENELLLLRGCMLEIKKNNQVCSVEDIPIHILNELEEYMSKQDAQADIQFKLTCPNCSKEWETGFDIQHYLWVEINAWAKNLLQEVYVLAKHFGWSENDILMMSPQRRQLYLQMIFA